MGVQLSRKKNKVGCSAWAATREKKAVEYVFFVQACCESREGERREARAEVGLVLLRVGRGKWVDRRVGGCACEVSRGWEKIKKKAPDNL